MIIEINDLIIKIFFLRSYFFQTADFDNRLTTRYN